MPCSPHETSLKIDMYKKYHVRNIQRLVNFVMLRRGEGGKYPIAVLENPLNNAMSGPWYIRW